MVFAKSPQKEGIFLSFLLSASGIADTMAGALAAMLGLWNGSHKWLYSEMEGLAP